MSETEELKSCPFCGGEAKLTTHDLDERYSYGRQAFVECRQCGAQSKMHYHDECRGYADPKTADPKAIAAWNTRTSDPAAHAAITALEAEVARKDEVIKRLRDGFMVLEAEVAQLKGALSAYTEYCPICHGRGSFIEECTATGADPGATVPDAHPPMQPYENAMTDPAEVARKLTSPARVALLQGSGCNDTHLELLDAGLWEPEFPPEKYPGLKQEYFLVTPLGLAVRAQLEKEG